MALLNEQQGLVADLAYKGHNLFIDGRAGTEKNIPFNTDIQQFIKF